MANVLYIASNDAFPTGKMLLELYMKLFQSLKGFEVNRNSFDTLPERDKKIISLIMGKNFHGESLSLVRSIYYIRVIMGMWCQQECRSMPYYKLNATHTARIL